MSETSDKKKKEQIKFTPKNNQFYKIYKSDYTLYRDDSGNFKQVNNYYFDNIEKTFYKRKIAITGIIITLYVIFFTLFYSLSYEMPYWKAMFEFADNYLFVGGLTLIIFLVFKRKKEYNKNEG